MSAERPGRVVDRDMVGWWSQGETYAARGGLTSTWDDLVAEHGPLRPVEPMSTEDRDALRQALRDAGPKAVTTLAAALAHIWEAGIVGYSAERISNAMIAGRPGSWEAGLLLEVAYFGRDLLAPPRKRVHGPSFDVLVDVLGRAVDDEGPHHELAETLAADVSAVADERGPDGWNTVVDQWLRLNSLARDDALLVYKLFYSGSEHYDFGAAYQR